MKSPIELIDERYKEIVDQLRVARNIGSGDVPKLLEHYNEYFIALQLLESHLDIPYHNTIVLTSHNRWKYGNIRRLKKRINKSEKI